MTTQSPTTDSVTSHDGTTIGYRHFGNGPGVILLHGGMQSSHNFMDLGTALADSFTVYLPDRRGRGLSGPASENHSLQDECEDPDALPKKTGAHNVFGVSSSATIALQAALTRPAIHKVAAYDPLLFTEQIHPIEWGERFERDIAHGKPVHALITMLKETDQLPRVLRLAPHFLLVPVLRYVLKFYEKKTQEPIMDLISTLTYDLQLIRNAHPTPESFEDLEDLSTEVLLLGIAIAPPSFVRFLLN